MKLIRFVLWVVAALILAAAFDQLMLRRTFDAPALGHAQVFYRDFRTRLLTLASGVPTTDQIGLTIESTTGTPHAKTSRYLYVDADGMLQFADSLAEVPSAFKKSAQPLAE